MVNIGGKDVAREVQRIDQLIKRGAFKEARLALSQLEKLEPTDPCAERVAVLGALSWYKDPELNPCTALETAAALLEPFVLESTNPETLGVAGAVERRFYEIDLRSEHLERALGHYRRGHKFDSAAAYAPRQGYPGINAAYLLDLLASLDDHAPLRDRAAQAAERRAEAMSLRTALASGLEPQIGPHPARDDYFLIVTAAEAHLGMTSFNRAHELLILAADIRKDEGWQLETTGRQLAGLLRLQAGEKPLPPEGLKALAALFGDRTPALLSAIVGKLGLALSGGGFRASFFHLGVLARLAELDLLRYVEVLSCVSGGSLVGAAYYLELQRLYASKLDADISRADYVLLVESLSKRFREGVQRNIRTRVLLNPVDNFAMLSGALSRTVRAGALYERYLYSQATPVDHSISDLKINPMGTSDDQTFSPWRDNWGRSAKVPVVVFNATTLNTGHNWQFTAKGMGEPPAQGSTDIDSNDRFERAEYAAFPPTLQQVPLGLAVGASACVPGIFEPVELRDAYGGYVVRLVDGGVHDNQGASALLEQGCTAIIVSDASGQMSLETTPSGDAAGVVLRTNSVLQARVREALYMDLRSRERGKLLRSLGFLHLKLGLDSRVVPVGGAAASVHDSTPTRYGVSRAVQERLAALRTDLDAFSDLEADMLMTSGLWMARQYIHAAAFTAQSVAQTPAADPQCAFSFERAGPLMAATASGDPVDRRVLALLTIGQSVLGKAWRVSAAAKAFGVLLLLALLSAAALLVRFYWASTVLHVTVGALLTFVAIVLVERLAAGARQLVEMATGDWLTRNLRAAVLSFVGAFGAWVSILIGDRLFLGAGKIEPLVKRKAAVKSASTSSVARAPSPAAAPMGPSPPRWVDEQVQFTVYRPQRVVPEVWCTMLVFAHLSEKRPGDPESAPDPVDEVARRAAAALADAAPLYGHSTQDATEGLPVGGELTLVPFVPGVTFNPATRSFQWREAVHEETFRLLASAALDGKTAHGRLTVFHGNIILAEINLAIAVGGDAARSTEPSVRDSARPYRKIFASYSHKDAAVVDEFSRHMSALGDQYLRDAVSLRSGEEWSERLAALIGEADIFQLFWSRHSMRSIHVRREWEHALSLQRNNFIRPTYWEEPLPAAVEADLPPEALRRLHFQLLQAPRRPDDNSALAPSPTPPPAPRGVLLRLSPGLAAAAGLVLVLGSGFAALHWGMATSSPIAVSPTLAPSAAPLPEVVGLQGQAPSEPIPIAAIPEASSTSSHTKVSTASPAHSATSKLAAIKKEKAMVDALLARMEQTNDPQQKSQLKEQLDAHERQLQNLERLNAIDTGY
jgi:predicted acylesterase/phospholipase RssA